MASHFYNSEGISHWHFTNSPCIYRNNIVLFLIPLLKGTEPFLLLQISVLWNKLFSFSTFSMMCASSWNPLNIHTTMGRKKLKQKLSKIYYYGIYALWMDTYMSNGGWYYKSSTFSMEFILCFFISKVIRTLKATLPFYNFSIRFVNLLQSLQKQLLKTIENIH